MYVYCDWTEDDWWCMKEVWKKSLDQKATSEGASSIFMVSRIDLRGRKLWGFSQRGGLQQLSAQFSAGITNRAARLYRPWQAFHNGAKVLGSLELEYLWSSWTRWSCTVQFWDWKIESNKISVHIFNPQNNLAIYGYSRPPICVQFKLSASDRWAVWISCSLNICLQHWFHDKM